MSDPHSLKSGQKSAAIPSGASINPLERDSELGWLIRNKDWSTTPIGPPQQWSPTLRTVVDFLIVNRFPLLLWWGPEYVSIYNDAYRPILGTKHPDALGKPFRDVWAEIDHVLRPLIDAPFNGGPATWMDDIMLEVKRHGFTEETHFTIAYSPVPDDTAPRGIGGVLATVNETTDKIVGERRITVLRDLGARAGEARTPERVCAIVAQALEPHAKDIPFALLYLLDASCGEAQLAASAGIEPMRAGVPRTVVPAGEQDVWQFARVHATKSPAVVDPLSEAMACVPPGPWSDPPAKAMVLPIRSSIPTQLAGFLVAGISPRLRLDDQYRGFLDLVAAQIAALEGQRVFDARIVALSKAHDILTREHWEGASLRKIVAESLAPHAGDASEHRLKFNGPEIRLRPKAALALSMALHELATNAVKYGAFSNANGTVEVGWRVEDDGHFALRWSEEGGPVVSSPGQRGFGSRLIEQGLSQDLGGLVSLDFPSSGVVCSIRAPLAEIGGK